MNIFKNDRHDLDPTEGRLIRVGHFLWKIYRHASDEPGIAAALESVWTAKRIVRQELQARRAASAHKLREYWENHRAA